MSLAIWKDTFSHTLIIHVIRKELYFLMTVRLDHVQRLLSLETHLPYRSDAVFHNALLEVNIRLGFKSSKHEHKIFFSTSPHQTKYAPPTCARIICPKVG